MKSIAILLLLALPPLLAAEPASREELVKWLRAESTRPPADWPAPTLETALPAAAVDE